MSIGSDYPKGADWWQANDGKWYPPTPTPATAASTPTYGDAASVASGGPGRAAGPAPEIEQPFMANLFDLSFSRFITPRIGRVLFVLGVILVSLYSLAFMVTFISLGGGYIAVGLIGAPIIWSMSVVYIRVLVELVIVFFKVEENTRR